MSQGLGPARREDRPRAGAAPHPRHTDTCEESQAARLQWEDCALLLTASATLGLGARILQSVPSRQARGHGPACLPRPQCTAQESRAHTRPRGPGASGTLGNFSAPVLCMCNMCWPS